MFNPMDRSKPASTTKKTLRTSSRRRKKKKTRTRQYPRS